MSSTSYIASVRTRLGLTLFGVSFQVFEERSGEDSYRLREQSLLHGFHRPEECRDYLLRFRGPFWQGRGPQWTNAALMKALRGTRQPRACYKTSWNKKNPACELPREER